MSTNIVFPVNNKGGVGKTSVLTDLSSALAQRYSVGVIDFDDQASLAGTLLGKDLACRSLDEYDLEVSEVTLTPATQFIFSDALGTLTLDVNRSTADVCVFPAGALYEHPRRRSELERILKRDMNENQFVAVDLPPIPHPGMIFDFTITPMIEALGGDVRLFLLLVATPDHNVVDIALRGFSKIAGYFEEKGVPVEKIHPMFVLNKVGITAQDERVSMKGFDPDFCDKLASLGILYVSPISSGQSFTNHVNKHFDYNGKRFRSVVFPKLPVADGTFSLLFGHKLQLHQYPHLVDLVQSHDFSISSASTHEERVYMHSIRQLVNYITAKAAVKPTRNFQKRRVVHDPTKVISGAIGDLRGAIENYFRDEEFEATGLVERSYNSSTGNEHYTIPKTMSIDQLAGAVYRTQRELDSTSEVGFDTIRKALANEDPGTETFFIYDREGNEIVSVNFHVTYDRTKVEIIAAVADWEYHKVDPKTYMPKLDVFLRHLANI